MESERYQQVRRVFAEASRLAGGERGAYLERECAGDPDLRREVERLRLLAEIRKHSPEQHHESLMDYPPHREVREASP